MTSNTPFGSVDDAGRQILQLSYIGCSFRHHDAKIGDKPCGIGWVRLRKDGWASIGTSPAGTAGALTIQPLASLRGAMGLWLNYDAGNGSLAVAVLDARTGEAIPGYEASSCDKLRGNSTSERVNWGGARRRLPTAKGSELSLSFKMQGSGVSLYSFALTPSRWKSDDDLFARAYQ